MNEIGIKIRGGKVVVFSTFSQKRGVVDFLVGFTGTYGYSYDAELIDNGVAILSKFYFSNPNREERRKEIAELIEIFKRECSTVE